MELQSRPGRYVPQADPQTSAEPEPAPIDFHRGSIIRRRHVRAA
ncbi:hypothetical protein TMO_a0040 (plasmid) [Tistrella mobilis KA081020-065]|uniref:Uncharacterized protein n=1 Tax=Tistrella mobilis (strain KA081020-065) TaxID=1110502 RepID=I3TRQ5_TISMK|nr:hypothetical protein TMO_a0040 [Tistrella mobilis KA081020-065]